MVREAVLILSLILAAASAQAQTAAPLRGARPALAAASPPQGAETEAAPSPAPAPAAPLASAASPPAALGDTAGQCRLSCAQSYYFCLASELADDCPGAWSQCRAACDAPGAVTAR
ncbi:MAG: hypothetical protein ACK4YQ_06070 [Phenylobacterium sp.]